MKKILLFLFLLAGCHKDKPVTNVQPSKPQYKMNVLAMQMSQSSDCSQLTLLDNTGANSTGNTGGWGVPNYDISYVTSVYISGTFRPYPSIAPPVTIPSTELMPSPNALPYNLWQEFQLTPALLGFGTTNFTDGILLYTVTENIRYYTVPFNSANNTFNVGDTILNTLSDVSGIVVSVTQAAGSGTLILGATSVHTIPSGTALSNLGGTTATSGTMSNSPFYTTGIITYIGQFEILCNADCCLTNKLSAVNFCNCSCNQIDSICCDIFMPIMGAKAMAGGGMNNSALDTIATITKRCQGCGCGCS